MSQNIIKQLGIHNELHEAYWSCSRERIFFSDLLIFLIFWRIPDSSHNASGSRYNFLLGLLGDDLEGTQGGTKELRLILPNIILFFSSLL